MRTTIDAAGRIVVPKQIREAAGLDAGQEIEIRLHGIVIEIEPVSTPMHVEQRGRLAVIVPEQPMPPLTDETVREVLDHTRDPQRRHADG